MMLKAENLNVYYGPIHAVKGVSFEVNEGEVVTLIGANGAGKSTSLKTISGLMRSRGGAIEFMGKSIASTPAHKIVELGIAHVPEGRRIFTSMTVEVLTALHTSRISASHRSTRLSPLLSAAGEMSQLTTCGVTVQANPSSMPSMSTI